MQWLERPTASGDPRAAWRAAAQSDICAGRDKKPTRLLRIERLQQQRQIHEDERCCMCLQLAPASSCTGWVSAERRRRPVCPPRTLCCKDCGQRSKMSAGVDLCSRYRYVGIVTTAPRLHATSRCEDSANWQFPRHLRRFAGGTTSAARGRHSRSSFNGPVRPRADVGTVVHRWLQRMGEDASAVDGGACAGNCTGRIQRELAAFGISGDDIKVASSRVVQALTSVVT